MSTLGRLLGVLALLVAGGTTTIARPAVAAPAAGTTSVAALPRSTPTDEPVRFPGLKPIIQATGYLFRSPDGEYDKPVVIPIGFDPFERTRDLTLDDLYALYSPFVDPARDAGYDVWIVQTLTGQNIHEQAAEYAQAVEYAADLLGPGGKVIVGAYSLGGLVARIATARWEDPGEGDWRSALGLRTPIPVSVIAFGDAPLKGANVSLNLQKAVWSEFHKQSDFNLDSCGAQQLLRFSEGGVHPDLPPGAYIYARNHEKFFQEGKQIRFLGWSPTADDIEVDDQGFATSICDKGPAVYSINGDGWAHRPRMVAFSDGLPGPTKCYASSRDFNRRGQTVCPGHRARPYVPQVGDPMYRIHVPLGGDYDAKAEAGDLEGGSRISTILHADVCPITGCYGAEQIFTGAFIPVSSAVPAGAPFAATRYNAFQGVHAFGYPDQIQWLLGQLAQGGGGGGPCPPTQAPVPQGPSGAVAGARPTFRWSAVEGAETYTLYVQRVSDGSVVLQKLLHPATSYRPPDPLPAGLPLRWKVKGECDQGRKAGPYSPDSHFMVTGAGGGPCPPTVAPTPGGPSGTITTARPTFTWSPVEGAETYTVYVQKVSTSEVVAGRALIEGTTYVPDGPLPAGIDLRWKVKGECDQGRKAGPYSASPQFRVQPAGPPPPSVTIAEPFGGHNVAGPTAVRATATSTAIRADFSVDGVVQATDTSAPFEFSWNPAANPLPAPNHPIDYGYMLADGRYGDYRAEVNGYTNLYHAWARRGYETSTGATDDEWLPLMQQSLSRVAAENRRIVLNLNLQEQGPGRVTPVDRVLGITGPFWDRVVRVELADEPSWDRAQTEAQINAVKAKIAAHGLSPRPMGNIYTRDQSLTDDAVFATNLDFVVVEAYVDPPGSADSQANVDALTQALTAAKNRIPAGKQIGFVMQAYARNGFWTNVDTLRDLQVPTYLLAYNDPRVIMISMFSYGRATGTRERPELTTPHRMIGEKILGRPVPTAGAGPRTLSVKVYDAAGASAGHRVTVRAQPARPGDFVGDHKAEPVFFRPSTGQWPILNPAVGPPLIYQFGGAGDIPVPGDYLGDAKRDLAVWRPASGNWFLQDQSTGQTHIYQWGLPGDIPVPGDYLGDYRTDLAVWRPSTGTWWILNPATGEVKVQQWGQNGDVPLAGDYFGTPRAELAIFRSGGWYLRDVATGETRTLGFGIAGDVPVAGDFLGDGRTELVVFRGSTGNWFMRDLATGETATHWWGVAGDVPVSADYLGDGRTELTVFRPSTGTWFVRDPNNGQTYTTPWGANGDIPVA